MATASSPNAETSSRCSRRSAQDLVRASPNDTGYGVGLVVDATGRVHIAYRDETAQTLKYAWRRVRAGWGELEVAVDQKFGR